MGTRWQQLKKHTDDNRLHVWPSPEGTPESDSATPPGERNEQKTTSNTNKPGLNHSTDSKTQVVKSSSKLVLLLPQCQNLSHICQHFPLNEITKVPLGVPQRSVSGLLLFWWYLSFRTNHWSLKKCFLSPLCWFVSLTSVRLFDQHQQWSTGNVVQQKLNETETWGHFVWLDSCFYWMLSPQHHLLLLKK